MVDEAELRRMSPAERARLARAIAALDVPHPLDNPVMRLERRVGITLDVVACVALACWIGVLAVTLPRHFRSGDWRTAWVGFDGALLAAFAVTAWASWRRRQMLIVCLIVTATLLCCDAWFDITLDWGTRAVMWSLLSGLLIELPVAALMIVGARRLLRLTVQVAMTRDGHHGPVPPLWRLALFGLDHRDGRHLRRAGDAPEPPAPGRGAHPGR